MPSASRFLLAPLGKDLDRDLVADPFDEDDCTGPELKRRQIQLVCLLDCRERDREVLDREPRRVERRDLLLALTSGRRAGEHVAELGRPVSRSSLPASTAWTSSPLWLACSQSSAKIRVREELADCDLGLARAVGAHEAHVLARLGASLP